MFDYYIHSYIISFKFISNPVRKHCCVVEHYNYNILQRNEQTWKQIRVMCFLGISSALRPTAKIAELAERLGQGRVGVSMVAVEFCLLKLAVLYCQSSATEAFP